MTPELDTIASWLQATGPYGLVVVLGYAFWRMYERKDAAIRELSTQLADLIKTQTAAITSVEATLTALERTVDELKFSLEKDNTDERPG